MPTAFSIANGLDWDTEAESFWSWLHEARVVIEGDGEADTLVRHLISTQKQEIERVASEFDGASENARFILSVAIALVGHNYASNQKLLKALGSGGISLPISSHDDAGERQANR